MADNTKAKAASAESSDAREPIGSAGGSKPTAAKPSAGLYLVATPIGNLADVTMRARDHLAGADLIACEDTRVTGRLLSAFGIATPMTAYHEHNAARVRPKLIEQIKCGKAVALVSDAGSPLISDPGYKLVRAAIEAGLPVTSLPGPSALVAALQLSGLPSDRFFFGGFLPAKTKARRDALGEVAALTATLVFFESPRRLTASLADMAAVLGPRPAAVARELTKRFEEVVRGDLGALAEDYAARAAPKGEIVVIIGPPAAEAAQWSDAELDARLTEALGTGSLKDAVAGLAKASGRPKREVYDRALRLAEAAKGPRR